MKAVVYQGIGEIELADVKDPRIEEPRDAVVRITASAICGTDLHLIRGTLTGMVPGTVLGHEGVGVVEEVGEGVRNLQPGDRVVVASTIACRFVLLNQGGWDMHANIFQQCDTSLPGLDRSISVLLKDMKERGLLAETLVAMYGDFGRTSKINKDNGRDHWGNAGVMIFAGAGVRGGQVIGKTDERGEYVLDRPVRPPEVAATIYHALGIDHTKALMTPQSRPVYILPDTEPISELWS